MTETSRVRDQNGENDESSRDVTSHSHKELLRHASVVRRFVAIVVMVVIRTIISFAYDLLTHQVKDHVCVFYRRPL